MSSPKPRAPLAAELWAYSSNRRVSPKEVPNVEIGTSCGIEPL